MKETIKKLPPELNEYKAFRVATIDKNKKVTIDINTGKWQRGAKATHPLYTLDDLRDIKLPKNADCIQFVPKDTPYTILDFDIDKSIQGKDLADMKDHIENVVLQGFEGLVEDSSSKKGMHAYCEDNDLKKYIGKNKTKLRDGLYVEIFNSDFPIVLTADYYPDNIFNFGTCPPKLLKALGDPLPASTEEGVPESILEAKPSDAIADGIEPRTWPKQIESKFKEMDQMNLFNGGYPHGGDCSNNDAAAAGMLLKITNWNKDLAYAYLLSWMNSARSKTDCPCQKINGVKDLVRKAKSAITSEYKKRPAPKKDLPKSMSELVKKFSIPKEQREILKTEEVDMFKGLMFKGQITSWIAMPNGGKTALAIEASKAMAQNGFNVFYIYEDSGLGGYTNLANIGDEYGFDVISSNNGGVSASADTILESIVGIANSGENMSKHVYIFDTLKKFTSVLDKSSIKELFNSLRKINSKGGTVLLLGHAVKHYNQYNKLEYDGVGDILADGDAMYYIYHCGTREKNRTRHFTVENEKDRAYGTTREVSFVLPPNSYDVEFIDEVMDVRKLWFGNQYREDVENAKAIIRDEGSITQTELIKRVYTNSPELGRRETKKLLLSLDGKEWFTHKGGKNANIYTLDDPASTEKKVPEFLKDM